MNLSKANKAKYQGWTFHPSKKIADEPLYIGYPISRDGKFKVIVLRFPINPNKTDYRTPVVFESATYSNVNEAWVEARKECL